jgi:hypothetical protein
MAVTALPGILLVALVEAAAAQAGDRLPGKLSGHWTYIGSRTYINPVTIVFDGDGAPGPVTGRLTWRGVTCGAQDEPLNGTWNGTELRFTAALRANVNVESMNAQCGDARFTLTRKPGEQGFDGDARASYTPAVPTISLAP